MQHTTHPFTVSIGECVWTVAYYLLSVRIGGAQPAGDQDGRPRFGRQGVRAGVIFYLSSLIRSDQITL